jgi:peptidoglycan hydrolase CwlO-like protein
MKLLFIILGLSVVALLQAELTPVERDWIEGARSKIAQLQKEHDEAIAQANEAASTNASAQMQLEDLVGQVQQITTERDQWVKYGNDQHDKFMAVQKQIEAQKAAILRRDLIITFLTVAIGIYAVLKFWFHVPFL